MSEETNPKEETGAEEDLYASHPKMFRNHPFGFVLCVLVILAGVVGAPTALLTLEEHAQPAAIASGVGAAIAVVVMLRWWFRTLATKLSVTSRRTVLRRGLLSKHINEISHANIRNVQVKQSPVERLFSTGTVKIASAGQGSVEIEVEGLPHPQQIRELINKHQTG